jgi:Zn-dependent metalloprotease
MNGNGLRTFAFHAEDEASSQVLNALRAERAAFPAFRTTDVIGLANLDPETAARQHLQQILATEAIPQFSDFSTPEVNSVSSEFKSLGTETLPLTDTRIVKFRQTHNKIPVYGSLVTVEMDYENELLAVNSSLGEPANVDPVARVSPADALEKVRVLAGHEALPVEASPQLYYYFDAATNRWRLVYVIEDISKLDEETIRDAAEHIPLLVDYVIDAHTGDLVAELPRTPSISGGGEIVEDAKDALGKVRRIRCLLRADGVKILRDEQLNVHTHDFEFQDLIFNTSRLPGRYVGTPPDPWNAGAVSAHANAVVVARFLLEVLRRNGIDNLGGPFVSSINCINSRQPQDDKEWRNAQWRADKQMVYGQRKVNGELRSYAAGLDVVGHEIFHGVTSRTARLEYLAQSGALNESYSDIFGIIISNFEKADSSSWNWELGEETEGTGIPLRDLSEPTKYGQPAHMRDYENLPVTIDNGGVHINSGIHNLAAYMIMTAKDTQGEYLFDAASVAALFYLTLTQRLAATSLFSDSRRSVESTALTLFRNDEPAVRNAKQRAISEAFNAVGIQ